MDAAQELVKVVFESDKHFKIPFFLINLQQHCSV